MTDTNSLRTGAGYALDVGLYATHKAMIEAANTIDTLCSQLAEAQRDSERLDWLNANACEFVMESNNKAIPGFSYHPNVRAAIDAAKGEPS